MGWLHKLYFGFKVALAVARKLEDRGVTRIKELPKAEAVVEALEAAVKERP